MFLSCATANHTRHNFLQVPVVHVHQDTFTDSGCELIRAHRLGSYDWNLEFWDLKPETWALIWTMGEPVV